MGSASVITAGFISSGIIYPALTGSKTPTKRLRRIEEAVGGGQTASKSPIGSTNHQWGMKDSPLVEVSPYVLFLLEKGSKR